MKMSKRTVAAPVLAAFTFLGAGPVHAGSSIAVAAESHFSGCSGPLSVIDIDVAVTAGSAAPFTIAASLGGGAFTTVGTFANWASYGRTKGAEETFQVSVPGATAMPLTVCVAQPGNDSRSACTTVTVESSCDGGSGTGLL